MATLLTMPVFSGDSSKSGISAAELSRRVAVVKRFKELLQAQRDRFRSYLDALDKQKDTIERGTADDLIRHVELEEKIVSDIFSIQKVIDPLEKMYRDTGVGLSPVQGFEKRDEQENEVSGLKEALEILKAEAVVRAEQNRELLAKRMAELRSEIKNLRSNPYARRSPGFDSAPAPSQIDIRG